MNKNWREGIWPFLANKIDGLIFRMEDDGLKVAPWEGFRSFERQEELFKLGRTVRNPDGACPAKPLGNRITKARGGESIHNFGLACDMVFIHKGGPSWAASHPWGIMGRHAESLGIEWGSKLGRDPMEEWDQPHFQITAGMTLDEIRANSSVGAGLPRLWDVVYNRLMSR